MQTEGEFWLGSDDPLHVVQTHASSGFNLSLGFSAFAIVTNNNKKTIHFIKLLAAKTTDPDSLADRQTRLLLCCPKIKACLLQV